MTGTKQKTIAKSVSISGVGLHTGHTSKLTFQPAEINTGIRFVRTDLSEKPVIPALVTEVVLVDRGTTLGHNGAEIHTVEHILAAVAGLGIDNLTIEVDGDEPPAADGSAKEFVEALISADVIEQDAPREYLAIEKTLIYHNEEQGVDLVIVPSNEFRVTYMIDYPNRSLGTQYTSLYSMDEFVKDFAPARTFCLLSEAKSLKESGLIQGGNLDNAVVFVDQELDMTELKNLAQLFHLRKEDLVLGEETLGNRPLRFPNEPARHKVADLIGDLTLVGLPIRGHVLAARSGHAAHIELAKLLRKEYEKTLITRKYGSKSGTGYIFDAQAIERLIPHRYPMLLVDRILELTPAEKVVGLKNVSRNEPFFDGHFPGHSIMPGVLLIEAMGQTGGVLLLNSVENPESKVVYFTGLDNVRFRKPVIPGDQIIFTVEMSMFRRNICKMSGIARVEDVIVAEADLSAVVIDR
ncbi:bifunctional UDP-3-O-[3-hydroxymyristoyl] N-acetylglucosamine deacetylase/3-hydroxyacyl-ACP dehydratase [bacterium]|nr:bifunctional UDP-3-O-[3-hydroxymyristoyl] N-acetylglucosamine deacetylase/3-hydroxyacyl-ACP dehydratase [bacterium]